MQPLKTYVPSSTKVFGKTIELNFVQFSKLMSPILVVLFKSTFSKFLQSLKAYPQISLNESGAINSLIPDSANASFLI